MFIAVRKKTNRLLLFFELLIGGDHSEPFKQAQRECAPADSEQNNDAPTDARTEEDRTGQENMQGCKTPNHTPDGS